MHRQNLVNPLRGVPQKVLTVKPSTMGNTVRSEVIAEWRDYMTGVYLITNTITGAKYVGQSVNIERRMMEHRTPNSSLKSKSKRFADDIIRYGIESFTFEVLEECPVDRLLETEKKWIKAIKPDYNTVGRTVPYDQRRKISDTLKKRWESMSDEEKQRIITHNLIGPRKGHEVSEHTRQKLREANLGRRRYHVRVVETGIVYGGARECAEALGCDYFSVLNQLSGRTKNDKRLSPRTCRD